VNATLRERNDAASLAPASAHKGVEAEGESDKPGNGKEETLGEGRSHTDLPTVREACPC